MNNSINNTQQYGISKNQDDLMNILSLLFNLGYQESSKEEYITEILGNSLDMQEIGKDFFNQIKSLIQSEINKNTSPVTMIVENVNIDGSLTLRRLDGGDSWTNVYNPTIFNHLSKGDEVVVGFHNGQVSNCYVIFAKIKKNEYKEKTIMKDILKLKDINNNIEILHKWMDVFVQNVFPDIDITDTDGNVIDTKPNPKRLEFQDDMKNWIDIKIEGV